MRAFFNTILLISGIFIGCSSENQQSAKGGLRGTITMSGSFALYPLAHIWAEEFKKLHPDVRFNISAGGAGKGMADVLGGAVDVALFSRDIKSAEKDKGALGIAVAKDAVIPTVSSRNPLLAIIKNKGLSAEDFHKIYVTGEYSNWGDLFDIPSEETINLYTRSDAAGAASVWADFAKAKGQEALKGVGVFGDPGLAEAIKGDKWSIGYNNLIFIYDINSKNLNPGIEVIPLDINNNNKIDDQEKIYGNLDQLTEAISLGNFPSPPARELYFVTKGTPEKQIVKEFLKWVLLDGQSFVSTVGFVKLTAEEIQEQKAKLNL